MRARSLVVAAASVVLLAGLSSPAVAADGVGRPCARTGVVKPVGHKYVACTKWQGKKVWRYATAAQIRRYVAAHGGNTGTGNSGQSANGTADCYRSSYDSTENYFTQHGTPTFRHLPFPIEVLDSIVPMGEADSGPKITASTGGGAHNIPSDHSSPAFRTRVPQPTYAVGDGTLVAIGYTAGRWQSAVPDQRLDDYNLTFQFTANFFLRMTHFTSLEPTLLAAIGPLTSGRSTSLRIPIAGGTLLGNTSGSPHLGTTDFWAIDYDAPSVAPKATQHLYSACENRSVDPYQYFVEPLRSQLYSKLPDRPAPRIGQYNFDGLGGLYGNWWKESDLIDGKARAEPSLAFFLHNIDPSIILVGNRTTNTVDFIDGPDPAQVPVGGAPVAFALRNKGGNPDVAFQAGMMLVQFVSSTRVRAEVFPNATPADPIAFGANAQDFVR